MFSNHKKALLSHFHNPSAVTSSVSSGHFLPARGQHRTLFTSIPTFLTPPLVFLGLLATLWTYKCAMTVIFQDKIIYMPYMPPFARSEKLENYSPCSGIAWHETVIRSLDGTRISLAIGRSTDSTGQDTVTSRQKVVLAYFHGNGASLPPRVPFLSHTLKACMSHLEFDSEIHDLSIVALSYRGYWTSSGRATETGIRKDAQAALSWIETMYPGCRTILWGQSIGAGVASTALAGLSSRNADGSIIGLILETPFTSIKSMLVALYPQKWLPYQYLWPFLWNHWNLSSALKTIADGRKPPVFLMTAKRDEVVPPEEATKIDALLGALQFDKTRYDVFGSLHTEASTRREGQDAIARFVSKVVKQQHNTPQALTVTPSRQNDERSGG